jgi:hypothetical protein
MMRSCGGRTIGQASFRLANGQILTADGERPFLICLACSPPALGDESAAPPAALCRRRGGAFVTERKTGRLAFEERIDLTGSPDDIITAEGGVWFKGI